MVWQIHLENQKSFWCGVYAACRITVCLNSW